MSQRIAAPSPKTAHGALLPTPPRRRASSQIAEGARETKAALTLGRTSDGRVWCERWDGPRMAAGDALERIYLIHQAGEFQPPRVIGRTLRARRMK